MTKTFLVSDTHFGQGSMLRFKDAEGNPVRDFPDVETMDKTMIERWNDTVGPDDLVYHLGDVAMRRPGIRLLEKLHGRKKLIRGNHDIEKAKFFLKFFDDVLGVKVFPEHLLILSHYPIHPDSLWAYRAEKWKINVHGHTHTNIVGTERTGVKDHQQYQTKIPDLRYMNLCVEHTDYTPVLLDDVIKEAEHRREILQNEKPF